VVLIECSGTRPVRGGRLAFLPKRPTRGHANYLEDGPGSTLLVIRVGRNVKLWPCHALERNFIATSFLLATSVLLALCLTHTWSSVCHRLSLEVIYYRFSISRQKFNPEWTSEAKVFRLPLITSDRCTDGRFAITDALNARTGVLRDAAVKC